MNMEDLFNSDEINKKYGRVNYERMDNLYDAARPVGSLLAATHNYLLLEQGKALLKIYQLQMLHADELGLDKTEIARTIEQTQALMERNVEWLDKHLPKLEE